MQDQKLKITQKNRIVDEATKKRRKCGERTEKNRRKKVKYNKSKH